jgi:hypothetical protein
MIVRLRESAEIIAQKETLRARRESTFANG